jgi:hypothetical protein
MRRDSPRTDLGHGTAVVIDAGRPPPISVVKQERQARLCEASAAPLQQTRQDHGAQYLTHPGQAARKHRCEPGRMHLLHYIVAAPSLGCPCRDSLGADSVWA